MSIIQIPSLLFTPGRACAGPLVIVLHEYRSGLEMLDAQMERCPRPRPAQSPGCHTSFHYGINFGCDIHQYVDNDDTAWGFGVVTPTCPEPVCDPTACESCTGLTADQYNVNINTGLPPTLPVWVVGPDGTVNCAVKHVAITGVDSQGFVDCCTFLADPKAYRCFISALCQIFAAAGIVPTVNNLLVHCGELVCLDITQIVADILAFDCTQAPVNPCTVCPPLVDDTDSIDLTITGATVTADAIIDPAVDNQLSVSAAGLYVPPGVTLVDCNGDDIDETFEVVTREAFEAAGTTNGVAAIWASDNTEGSISCPQQLVASECADGPFNELPIVLGSTGVGGFLEWGNPQRPPLSLLAVTNGNSVDPSDADVFTYSGVGVASVTLNAPVGACSKSDVWFKNLSASVLTIVSGDNIDGVGAITLAGTIPAGYPYGNNGGEAVHLVYDPINTTWYVV